MICELSSLLFGLGVLTLGVGIFTFLRGRDKLARAESRLTSARAKERRAYELVNLTPYAPEKEVTQHG